MTNPDDLSRDVYGVLGIPIDAIDLTTALSRIGSAAAKAKPFLISTANLNFLITSQSDAEFRESLLVSDLCTADGMPIVWIARLFGIPIKDRVAGSDMFERLKSVPVSNRPLKIFLFGGREGAAAAACKKLNSDHGGMTCVGSFHPGFGTVDEMSADTILGTINSSEADFLVAALGAKKGQAWLLRNHDQLRIPIRAHLGAVINIEAGTIKRAPACFQTWGLEWLWRIKEEPQLWRRYWKDGFVLFELIVTRVVPLFLLQCWHRCRLDQKVKMLLIERAEDYKTVILNINGAAIAQNIESAVACFRNAASSTKNIVINFASTSLIDARFLGLLLMLSKQLKRERLQLTFTGVTPRVERLFSLNGFGFLLRMQTESTASNANEDQ